MGVVRKEKRILEAVAVLALTTLCTYSTTLPVFRQELQDYLYLRIEQFGILISAAMLASSVAMLVCAYFISRIGTRRMLLAGLVSCAGGMAVVGVSSSFVTVAFGASVMGAAALVVSVAGQADLASLFPHEKRRALSMQMAATSVGFVVWPLAAEALIEAVRRGIISFAQALHWPYLVIAGCIAVGSLVLPRGRHESSKSDQEPPEQTASQSLFSWPLGLLILMSLLHTAPDNALYMWVPRVLASGSYPEIVIRPGLVLSLFGLAYLVTRLVVGILPSGYGNKVMLILPGLTGGTLLIAAVLTRDQMLTGIGVVAGGAAWSLEYPALLAAISAETGSRFGRALALSSVLGSIATFILSALMGWAAGLLGETRLWILLLIPGSLFPLVSVGGIAYYRCKRGGFL